MGQARKTACEKACIGLSILTPHRSLHQLSEHFHLHDPCGSKGNLRPTGTKSSHLLGGSGLSQACPLAPTELQLSFSLNQKSTGDNPLLDGACCSSAICVNSTCTHDFWNGYNGCPLSCRKVTPQYQCSSNSPRACF